MSGATGMVGSYVLALSMRRGDRVLVLARDKTTGRGERQRTVSAADRIDDILSTFEQAWNTSLPRPVVLTADLRDEQLGLSDDDVETIHQHFGDQPRIFLHSAASLSFAPASSHPDNEPFRTNVDATASLLDFCQRIQIERFHHVSTAYVCGLREGVILESQGDVGQSHANDYERSKTIAEGLVADRYHGDSLTIYRPSIVVDPDGLAPVSGDRTIYGAYAMYQSLAGRFGLPDDQSWMRSLGFGGAEKKNLVDANWVASAMVSVIANPALHGRCFHLTATGGTPIADLDKAFHDSASKWLAKRRRSSGASGRSAVKNDIDPAALQKQIDQMSAPFVETFLPYFRDDPQFDQQNIHLAISQTDLESPPVIDAASLSRMIHHWTSPSILSKKTAAKPTPENHPASDEKSKADRGDRERDANPDDIVICGYAVRLPGDVNDVDDFEALLFGGQSAIRAMPADRLDKDLYFDHRKGVPGKTYSDRGGWVDSQPLDRSLDRDIKAIGKFDLTHRQFASVAVAAMRSATGGDRVGATALTPEKGGIFVGHSGGTEAGGPLAMAIQAPAAVELICQIDERLRVIVDDVVDDVQKHRPRCDAEGGPFFDAYRSASLAGQLIGLRGRREVIDAACSSSLVALGHAKHAIDAGRLDYAIVGGATFNNVDNLALFSQSQACSDGDCRPFDRRAGGLISSEGYVAIVVARRSTAEICGMPIHAVVGGVGVASDGKGKGLWAPRTEGQQLAMQRAVDPSVTLENRDTAKPETANQESLTVDYMECHATSTQVGDATELESLTSMIRRDQMLSRDHSTTKHPRLPIGSAKSNLGHLLEAAGLVGMVKCLIAMRRGVIPPSIGFGEPTERFDWDDPVVEVVVENTPWPSHNRRAKSAGINAFGIGGLNAHARVKSAEPTAPKTPAKPVRPRLVSFDPIAIVAADVVLPGAENIDALNSRLRSGQSVLASPPPGRWPTQSGDRLTTDDKSQQRWIGIGDGPMQIPHAVGGYIEGFQFDAQSYRIPPKLVRNANPAQLMLIETVRRAIGSLGDGFASLDRGRIGVSVGTIFGGQFSNELQVGLRIPELQKHIDHALAGRGICPGDRDEINQRFRQIALERYPALLDETGGFTASTLASAIARTFDLMGGAYAVDADQASGLLAMLSGIERLHGGEIDMAIIGAAHRSNDLVCLHQLYRRGQLADPNCPTESLQLGNQIFPGEGVATILLQRHRDALAAGRKILGVITGVEEHWNQNVAQARQQQYDRSRQQHRYSSERIVGQIGHSGGAHALVQTIAQVTAWNDDDAKRSDGDLDDQSLETNIAAIAEDGYGIELTLRPRLTPVTHAPLSIDLSNLDQPATNGSVANGSAANDSSASGVQCFRLAADDIEQMRSMWEQFCDRPKSDWPTGADRFSNSAVTSVLAGDDDTIVAAAKSLLRRTNGSPSITSSVAGGWVIDASEIGNRDRIGWLFPGQGSQYPGVPSVVFEDAVASASLQKFDDHLAAQSLEPIAEKLEDASGDLGRDVWWTQAWVLATGVMMTDVLKSRGHRPDVVLGHSFGECTAAYAAGVVEMDAAIEFARFRSEAVSASVSSDKVLLSIRTSPMLASAMLRQEIEHVVTHHNAPEQTVVAIHRGDVAGAKQIFQRRKIAAAEIEVPAPFHTADMAPAQEKLQSRFGQTAASPPRHTFLSAISNRYLAEPRQIIDNLIQQLTAPVHFAGAVDRMVRDGCGLLIEVGPSAVLTKLATSSSRGRALCIAADDRSVGHATAAVLIDAAVERFSILRSGSTATSMPNRTSMPVAASADQRRGQDDGQKDRQQSSRTSTERDTRPSEPSDLEVVDVTRRGRRNDSGGTNRGAVTPVIAPAIASATMRSGTNQSAERLASDLANDLSSNVSFAAPAVANHAVADPSEPDQQTDAQLSSSLQRMIIDLVVDQTGYDEDIIDMEADLEAELGVDSIKRAQLLGELETQYALESLRDQNLSIADFQTLGSIHAYVLDYLVKKKR